MLDNYKSSEVTESTQTNTTSSSLLFDTTTSVSTLTETNHLLMLWRMRWFFAWLFAAALLLSILASIVIAVITKNPLPALVPTPLLLSMRPLIRWLFPLEQYSKKTGILTE